MLILSFRNNSDSTIENHLDNDNDGISPIPTHRSALGPLFSHSFGADKTLISPSDCIPQLPPSTTVGDGFRSHFANPSGFVLFQGVSQNQMVDHHFRDQMATERYPPASSSYVTQKIKPSMASWVTRFGFSLKQHLFFANPLFQYFFVNP